MTKLLLTQYKLEFEHTDSTINDIVEKYNLNLEDLKGHELWVKGGDQHNDITIAPTTIDQTALPATLVDTSLEEQIANFKEKAMAHCLTFMEKDVRFAEVKEFKDIVSIVDSIDKSLRADADTSTTTVNVLVQNITEGFKDDC